MLATCERDGHFPWRQERMQQEQMKAEVEVAESQGEVAAAQEQLGSTWGNDG